MLKLLAKSAKCKIIAQCIRCFRLINHFNYIQKITIVYSQIAHNLDLKVIEQRKMLDLLKYERRSKKRRLTELEKEYESLLIENSKGELVKSKISSRARKVNKSYKNKIWAACY